MANRLLKCSLCGKILGTYPKYCPYCGGAPMTTDANPRIVEVPDTVPPDKASERSAESRPISTENWWEPKPAPKPAPKPPVTPEAASGAAFVPPPQNNAASQTVKPPKEKPQRKKPPEVKREKTKEERIIDRLSAVSTAVVFAVVVVCVWNYYHAHEEQVNGRLFGIINEAAEEFAEIPEDIPFEDMPFEDELDLSFEEMVSAAVDEPDEPEPSDPSDRLELCECRYGSFEMNTDVWTLLQHTNDKDHDYYLLQYTLDGGQKDITIYISFTAEESKKGLNVRENLERMPTEKDNIDVEFDVVNEYTTYNNARFTPTDRDRSESILIIFDGYTEADIMCRKYADNKEEFEKHLLEVISSIKLYDVERTDTE